MKTSMTDKDKIELMDYLLGKIKDSFTSQDCPVMVGTLNRVQAFNGFKRSEIGNPVFEYKDKYIIYIESNNGKNTVAITYNKNTLKPFIDFGKVEKKDCEY